MFVINPEIVARSETTNVAEEGCLSLPKQFGEVARFDQIRMRYLDRDAKSRRSRPMACSRAASSTRSTIWTAFCSSITCRR